MNIYTVSLAKNYNKPEPFVTDWDYELIGDVLRAEFDTYFAEQEAAANAGMGKTKQLLKGEYVKKFMIKKQINLANDPATDTLRSVFVLRPGEEKKIDKRAKDNLASRYEFKVKSNSDGTKSSPTGFMTFKLIEGSEAEAKKQAETFQVSGNDIEYFNETEESQEEKEEKFVCDECDKEFDSKKALNAHKLSHKKK